MAQASITITDLPDEEVSVTADLNVGSEEGVTPDSASLAQLIGMAALNYIIETAGEEVTNVETDPGSPPHEYNGKGDDNTLEG